MVFLYYLRSPIRQTRKREEFLRVMSAFLLKRIVSALIVGFVNFAKTIPAMQACKKNPPVHSFDQWERGKYVSANEIGGRYSSTNERSPLKVALLLLVDTGGKKNRSEPVFLNVYGAQEWIPRNEFRQPM
jgi:hypothetical protein